MHAHVAVAIGTCASGEHLIDAVVRPTLELIIEDAPAHLHKRIDDETGLAPVAPGL